MEIQKHSSDKYKCDYCSNDISILTKRLQEHPTSSLWIKHGQCCAACISPNEISDINKLGLKRDDNSKSPEERRPLPGNHNTNILIGLNRASKIEQTAKEKVRKTIQRSITIGRIIGSTGLAAGFIFFYYEYFTFAIICLVAGISGILLCRLGIWKKCHTG